MQLIKTQNTIQFIQEKLNDCYTVLKTYNSIQDRDLGENIERLKIMREINHYENILIIIRSYNILNTCTSDWHKLKTKRYN